MSIIGELLLWTPPVPRDTFLEENIIALVFAIVGVGSSFGGGKRLMFEANRLVPGLVVVVVCWVAMLIIVMLLLFLIEAVEKLNAFIVVHKEHLRLKDTALDLEERLHRHEVRERCVALEALWKDYEEATMLEDARGMAPSATDLSSLLAHVEDDPNAAVARENDLFVSAQARIEEQRLGLSRGPMTHEVKGPPVMVASPPRLKPLPHRPKRPPPPMPDVARMIMLQNRVVRAFQHPHAVGKAELGPKDLGLTDAQKAKLKLMSLRRKGGDAPVVPEPIPQEEKPELPRTTSERVAELKAEREAAAAEAAKEAEAAPLLSAEEEMAREMEAARREAEAMMASFQAAHEESKEAPPADVEAPQPSATGPRRLAPAFEQHASPARGGQHHSSSRGGQHASSLRGDVRGGARRKKKGPARRAPGH